MAHFVVDLFRNMVMLHGYVRLPEGKLLEHYPEIKFEVGHAEHASRHVWNQPSVFFSICSFHFTANKI